MEDPKIEIKPKRKKKRYCVSTGAMYFENLKKLDPDRVYYYVDYAEEGDYFGNFDLQGEVNHEMMKYEYSARYIYTTDVRNKFFELKKDAIKYYNSIKNKINLKTLPDKKKHFYVRYKELYSYDSEKFNLTDEMIDEGEYSVEDFNLELQNNTEIYDKLYWEQY